ncbi:MAG: TonB-dependent receptor [Deltaproteobacteria bacterium]|nr:TonB-dependent receptor [Deltaproteobacteria bacterium]
MLDIRASSPSRRRARWLARACWVAWLACAAGLAEAGAGDEAPASPAAAVGAGVAEPRPDTAPESLYFEDIPSVYTASKFEQPILEAPSAVTIVSGDEIRAFGYRTLADVLASVPGFFVSYDRNYTYVGVRGFSRPGDYNTRLLVLVDGHRLNESLFGTAPMGTDFPVDLDLVARVEVVRGPASALYGTHAFLGVINVVTRRGRDVAGAEVAAGYGSHDSVEVRGTAGGRVSGAGEALFSASYLRSGGRESLRYGELAVPPDEDGVTHRTDEDQSVQAFAKLSSSDFELVAGHGDRGKDVPTASYGTLFDSNLFRTEDQFDFADLLYRPTLAEAYSASLRLSFDAYHYTGDYPYAAEPGDDVGGGVVMNRDHADSQRVRTEGIFGWSIAGRNQLFVGADLRLEYRQFLENFDVDPSQVYTHVLHDELDWGVFAQDELRLSSNLLLNVGARFDQEDTAGQRLSPRAALIYEPIAGTTLKLLYGEAFRVPNFWEIVYLYSDQEKPQSGVRAEVLRSAELVLEQRLGAVFQGTASLYRYRIDDLINLREVTGDGVSSYCNLGRVEVVGTELALDWRPATHVGARASYSLQDSDVTEAAPAELTRAPRHLARLAVMLPVIEDALLSATEVRYVGTRTGVSGARSGDFVVVNETLSSVALPHGIDLSLSLYNLFDQRFSDPASIDHTQDFILQDGRTVWLRVGYRLEP